MNVIEQFNAMLNDFAFTTHLVATIALIVAGIATAWVIWDNSRN